MSFDMRIVNQGFVGSNPPTGLPSAPVLPVGSIENVLLQIAMRDRTYSQKLGEIEGLSQARSSDAWHPLTRDMLGVT